MPFPGSISRCDVKRSEKIRKFALDSNKHSGVKASGPIGRFYLIQESGPFVMRVLLIRNLNDHI